MSGAIAFKFLQIDLDSFSSSSLTWMYLSVIIIQRVLLRNHSLFFLRLNPSFPSSNSFSATKRYEYFSFPSFSANLNLIVSSSNVGYTLPAKPFLTLPSFREALLAGCVG